MNQISVPDCWEELTDYQQREIIHIISHTDTEDFTEQYIQIVQILLMKNDSISERVKMRKVLKNIPISNFAPALKFISEEPKLHHFPEIKGLVKPAVRMGDITIEQFSVCDTLFYRYQTEKKEVYLRQLVAALYRLDPKSESREPKFDKNLLPKVAEITDKIDVKEAERIGFIFGSVRMYIAKVYPSIFKSDTPRSEDQPVFTAKKKFTPFSQIVVMMAADELRLLGNLHECQKTLLYDFMNAFLESNKIHKLKNKA